MKVFCRDVTAQQVLSVRICGLASSDSEHVVVLLYYDSDYESVTNSKVQLREEHRSKLGFGTTNAGDDERESIFNT